jgi:hypothetical protein
MTVAAAPRTVPETIRAREDRVEFVEIPRRTYLAVDGCERPGGQTFQNAIATLYPVAYALHFRLKESGVKAPIGALEGVFWIASGQVSRWQLRLAVPDAASESDVEQAIRDAASRRTLPAFIRLHVLCEKPCTCAQLLHVGPYGAETESIARLRDGIEKAGFEPIGPHHEIYLNDPRQVGEAHAKTTLRIGIRRRGEDGPAEDD